jgi:hypothetical protein
LLQHHPNQVNIDQAIAASITKLWNLLWGKFTVVIPKILTLHQQSWRSWGCCMAMVCIVNWWVP